MKCVFCVHDESCYSRNLLPALAALFENHRDVPIEINIIHFGISWVSELKCLAESYGQSIRFLSVSEVELEELGKLPVTGFLNIGANLRFLIFKYFNEPVIYLDVDTLVVGDIQALLRSEWGPIAAVREPSRGLWRKKCNELDVPDYFNSGVMRIDPDFVPYNVLMERVHMLLNDYGTKISWGDQDILNLIFSDVVKFLPEEFNYIPGLSSGRKRIIHYAGRKPWSLRYRFWRHDSCYEDYLSFREITVLAGVPFDDYSPWRWLKYRFLRLWMHRQ